MSVAALGEGASDTDQQGEPGDSEVAQDRMFEAEAPFDA